MSETIVKNNYMTLVNDVRKQLSLECQLYYTLLWSLHNVHEGWGVTVGPRWADPANATTLIMVHTWASWQTNNDDLHTVGMPSTQVLVISCALLSKRSGRSAHIWTVRFLPVTSPIPSSPYSHFSLSYPPPLSSCKANRRYQETLMTQLAYCMYIVNNYV